MVEVPTRSPTRAPNLIADHATPWPVGLSITGSGSLVGNGVGTARAAGRPDDGEAPGFGRNHCLEREQPEARRCGLPVA